MSPCSALLPGSSFNPSPRYSQEDGTLVVPPFDNCLAGITVQRMMQLLPSVSGGQGACEGDVRGPIQLV